MNRILFKDILVLALASYAMKGDRERMMEAGSDSYMSKPIKVGEFLKATNDKTLQSAHV